MLGGPRVAARIEVVTLPEVTAIVFVVDDDIPVRESLELLSRVRAGSRNIRRGTLPHHPSRPASRAVTVTVIVSDRQIRATAFDVSANGHGPCGMIGYRPCKAVNPERWRKR
jgi:hypothetical protein